LLFTLLLSACSTKGPVRIEEPERLRLYQAKTDQLAGFTAWRLDGKLAVSDEKDGGSGTFRWNQGADGVEMDFHGALGRGAWRMRAGEADAQLTLADGTVHHADSVETLVRQQLGWEIPVEDLSWWVRGLSTPGSFLRREIDGEGNVNTLLQNGWTIDYGKYRDFDGSILPVKLTARRGEWKVKLVIRDWEMTEQVGDND
jgi:outer membrane lipoprotein LolB